MNCVYPNRWNGRFEEYSEVELDALIEHAHSCPVHAQLVDYYLSFGGEVLDMAFDLDSFTLDDLASHLKSPILKQQSSVPLSYVESSRSDRVPTIVRGCKTSFLEQIRLLIPMFPSPEYAIAGDEQRTGWKEDEQTYYYGRLRCKRRKSVEGDNLLLLQSADAAFANHLVLVGEKEGDLTLALLADNNPIHPGFVSVLNFGANESPRVLFADKILTVSDLSKLDPEMIRTSIIRVDETSELLAWKELGYSIKSDGVLPELIRMALKNELDN
jgi:hypothetical protein